MRVTKGKPNMLTYPQIQDLIPRASRNTEAVDHAFAEAVIQATLNQIDSLQPEPSVSQLNRVLWPYEVENLPPEELKKLMWLAKRLQVLPRGPNAEL